MSWKQVHYRLRMLALATVLLATPALGGGTERAYTVGALGDSITAGFNSKKVGNNGGVSWSTGRDSAVLSHSQRLRTLLGRNVRTCNVSVPGSRVKDLALQERVLRYCKPDYVTITIGANDVCAWTDDYTQSIVDMKTGLRATLARLVKANPQVTIILLPIPDLHQLWSVGVEDPSCSSRWRVWQFCGRLLGPKASNADRLTVLQMWKDGNVAIDEVAAEFPDNVVHDAGLQDVHFETRHLSRIDCFHPSILGQGLVAEKTWEGYLRWRESRGLSTKKAL